MNRDAQMEGIDCNSCESLCCRAGTNLALSEDEAVTLIKAGTDLNLISEQVSMTKRQRIAQFFGKPITQLYMLNSDCGNLSENPETGKSECSIYYDAERPAVCNNFSPGQYGCMLMRKENGIDAPEVFVKFKTLS